MLTSKFTRLLRRGLLLLILSGFLVVATSSSLPPRTQASNPNYYCSVTIVSEVNADHDCWQVYSQGSGCSSISFTDAHNKAITDALNNMPPNCSWQPFRIDSESCVDGSGCTP
jgi:hypothetical protein